MTRVVKNPYGEALAKASDNILKLIMQKRQLDQQEDQFTRQLEQRESEAARMFEQRGKALALQELAFFQPFHVGKTIAESPVMQDAMARLYPEFTPEDFADPNQLGGMTMGDPTFEEYMGQRAIEVYDSLDEDVRADLDERNIIGRLTGTATSAGRLQREEDLFDRQADAALQMMSDPRVMNLVARNFLGLPEQIDVTVAGRRYQWESESQARIALGIMDAGMRLRALDASLQEPDRDMIGELAADLVSVARDGELVIPNHMARNIVATLHGPVPEGMTKNEQVTALYNELPDHGKAAMNFYMDGVGLANEFEEWQKEHYPAAWYFNQTIAQMHAAGVPADIISVLGPQQARAMSNAGIDIIASRHVRGPFSNFYNIGTITTGDEEQEALPEEQMSSIMRDARADAIKYAEGKISVAELNAKYGRTIALGIIREAQLRREEQ